MDLPALLPEKLKHYGDAETEEQLFEELQKSPTDLYEFFGYMCGDETWSGVKHPAFAQKMIGFMTDETRNDRMDLDSIFFVADHLYRHYENLKDLIPLDLTVKLIDGEEQVNSLLFRAAGEYFNSRYRSECLKTEHPTLSLDCDIIMFQLIKEYVMRGEHTGLWRLYPETLFKLIDAARSYELEDLALFTEDVAKRYVDKANVFEMLERASKRRWPHLRNICFELVNEMEPDIKLYSSTLDLLRFEFVVISEDALDIFKRFKDRITHLIFRGALTQDSRFSEIVGSCPKLESLDISDTEQYTGALLDIPANLRELVLSNCLWLDHDTLRQLLEHCTALQRLNLSSNVHLNVNSWAVLRRSPGIGQLNLARCSQITDDELKVILQGLKDLTDLNLDGCAGISNRGFTDLSRLGSNLVLLNLTKTSVGDGALADIGSNLTRLVSLNLTRCTNFSAKGIIELVRGIAPLRVLTVVGCDLTTDTVKEIKTARPFLTLVRY